MVLKPSELLPKTCQLLAELVARYMDPDTVRLVNGDAPVVTEVSVFSLGRKISV